MIVILSQRHTYILDHRSSISISDSMSLSKVTGPASQPLLSLLKKLAACDSNLSLRVPTMSQLVTLNRVTDTSEWNLPSEVLGLIDKIRTGGDDNKIFCAFNSLPGGW